MATSKHFPVQNYSPRSDNDDYSYNETPYNSVSSFKGYHSNKNRNNSVTSAPPYSCSFEVDDGASYIPYTENTNANAKKSAEANNRSQVLYIDNTVVSAYRRSKPPIPTQKPVQRPRIPKSSNWNQPKAVENNTKVTNSDDKNQKKFGIEHLQSLSKQLQNENKEHKRLRNSKEVPVGYRSGTVDKDSSLPAEIVNEQLDLSLRETGTPSPDSRAAQENGRHSSMSRRRLPKIPPDVPQSRQSEVDLSVNKGFDAHPIAQAKATDNASGAEIIEKRSERRHSLQCDSDIVPVRSLKLENKVSGGDIHGSTESPRSRLARKLGKHRQRDKKRSQSLGDQTKTEAQTAINMMSGIRKDNKNGLNVETVGGVYSANDEHFYSDVSSHQDRSSISIHSPDSNSDKRVIDNRSEGVESGNVDQRSGGSYQSRSKSESSQGFQGYNNEQVKRTHSTSCHPSTANQKEKTNGVSHKHLEKRSNVDDEVDQNEEDYSIVKALHDIVDNATAELSEKMPENVFFTFDHAVIQELTDSVMGNNEYVENVESANIEIRKSNEIFNDTDVSLNRTLSNEGKQAIEGKSFFEKSPDENEKINKSKLKTNENKNSQIGETDNKLSIENAKLDYKCQENETTTVKTQKTKVERSPSYRKKVMARAKSRHKKSSTLKECSCTRNENGEIIICSFCENYENRKRRSKSSLGLESAGLGKDISEFSEGENSDISSYSEMSSSRRAFTPGLPPLPSSKSPRPLRKLQVSSRVDVLMSSNLFKKHLHKHENLLQKHTMFRRAGMRKSVSNLDLTEGYIIDSDSQCETESVTSEIDFENDISAKEDVLSQSHDFTKTKKESRRHSLTGDTDIPVEKSHKEKKKHFRTLPSSVGRVRPPIPSFTQPKSRPNIPTFKEYKCLKELSKSTEALNSLDRNDEDTFQNSDMDKVDGSASDLHSIKKQDHKKVEKENEVDVNRTVEPLPLQLQVIKESHSKENLLETSNTLSEDSLEADSSKLGKLCAKKTKNETTESKKVLVNDTKQILDNNSYQSAKNVTNTVNSNSNINNVVERLRDNADDHEQLSRQQSAPNLKPHQQRVRPKLKSRTLSRLELESECLSDTASGTVNSSVARERKKHGAKRPRSLISKKSSLVSLIQESESKGQCSEEENSSSEKSISSRPKLKVGHNVNRSKSDSRYEMGKAKSMLQEGEIHPGHLAFIDKGRNTVSFDLDDTSRCSPLDIGESETSTSMAESLSDSLRSEVNIEDNLQLPYSHDDPRKHLHDQDDVVADDSSFLKPLKEELTSQVLRSTSDACEITQEAARKRRERKERPYKSDPFSGTEIIPASKRCVIREEKAKLRQHMDFANSSKEEILTFLDGVSHGDIAACDSFPSLEELNEDDEQLQMLSEGDFQTSRKLRKHLSNVSSLSTDSGVIGQDGSHDSQQSSPTNTLSHSQSEQTMSSSWQHSDKERSMSSSCADFAKQIQECAVCGPQDMIDIHRCHMCTQCLNKMRERKEIIQEIMETEMNYGRDLNILKEEFYKPIMKAGLLNMEQLDAIFLNLEELIHVNKHFITKLKSAIHAANQNGDNELGDVMIGYLFLESSTMFLTFENYCVNQAQAPVLLEQLEREKELLRIFLQVSQNDNHQLRRMHLKSFLMVPVQRIMKYPLLLDRLYKTTPAKHLDKNSLKEAKDKIEDILGHINAKSRTVSFRQRKPSQKSTQHCSVTEKIEVSRVALETLQWNRKDVCDVITSQLYVTQPVDHLWAAKKCKNYKFTTVYGVLLTLMQQPTETTNDNDINIIRNSHYNSNNENNNSRVKSAAVVFIKEKNGRYQVMREPFMLERCVVSQDPEYTDVFEILEWSKEAFLIKAETPQETKLWVQNLRQQMNNLGFWRKRRNALPNILLNHLS